MIDLVNTQIMSREERDNSLFRALHSQCFFNLLDFQLIAAASKIFQYGAKAEVDKDFWVTECKGNFGQVFADVASLYVGNIYVANKGESLHRYIAGENIPTAFQVTDIRDRVSPLYPQIFDDRQREMMPTLVRRGDNIIARVQNVTAKSDPADVKIVISGYYTQPENYLSGRSLQGVNESLADDPRFELWKFDVDYTGQKNHILNNDRFARMVLGFGIALKDDANDDSNIASSGTVQITDVYRAIRFNNLPINIAFFAPKVNLVRDTHIYYLPIEHFWEPFAPMKFDIVNALNGGTGYEWVMLTRTV